MAKWLFNVLQPGFLTWTVLVCSSCCCWIICSFRLLISCLRLSIWLFFSLSECSSVLSLKQRFNSFNTAVSFCCITNLKSAKVWHTGLKLIRVTPLHVTLEEEGIEEGFIAAWALNRKQMKWVITVHFSKPQNKKTCKQSLFRFWLYYLFKFTVWLSIIYLITPLFTLIGLQRETSEIRQVFGVFLTPGASLLTSLALHASCHTLNSNVQCVCHVMHCFSDWHCDHVTPYGSSLSKTDTPQKDELL